MTSANITLEEEMQSDESDIEPPGLVRLSFFEYKSAGINVIANFDVV